MVKIKVPPLGESISEATIAKWNKQIGDPVKTDELLVELETDKVTLEVNATTNGVLKSINFNEGDTVLVNDDLAEIEEGEITNNISKKEQEKDLINDKTTKQFLSPAASKIALDNNVSTNDLIGTGKDGRITKSDVINVKTSVQTLNPDSHPREERVKMSRLRVRIAERLKESQNNAAILTTFNEVDMTNIIEIRKKYKDKFLEKHKVKLGFMSFFVKASIAALKEIPAVNAEIDKDYIVYKNHYDIGVAVGTEQGLVVPVVRNANLMSFADIEKEIANLGKKAKDGKLSMTDLTGGTFTVSNGGVYGSLLSTPILNPPQSGILGMHKTQERVMVVNGKMEIRPMMYLALSYDHRIIDGKEAVTFLIKIKELIEDPERLLFDV